MKYRTKHFGIKITLVTILVISMWLLAGCSAFEQKINEHNNIIKCYPEDAVGCIGWLGDKPLYIEEDL